MAGSLTAAAAVNPFTLNFGDKTNCIRDLQQPTDNGQWFTIDGRLIGRKPTQPGIYISKGKKIFVK